MSPPNRYCPALRRIPRIGKTESQKRTIDERRCSPMAAKCKTDKASFCVRHGTGLGIVSQMKPFVDFSEGSLMSFLTIPGNGKGVTRDVPWVVQPAEGSSPSRLVTPE